MATAKKLPSGSYRIRVYSHTDSSGKKHYESFTAPTKAQAEMLASKFANDIEHNRTQDLTVKQAVDDYINSNKGALSPSTLRGYMMAAKRLEPINKLKIRKLTSKDLQEFIKSLIENDYSPKTIKNTYSVLLTSLTFSGVDTRFKVNLPTVPQKTKYAPESEQITALFQEANPTMKKVLIMACHSMRLSEICGCTYGDLTGNKLYVHQSMVKGPDGWTLKPIPKTNSSYRYIVFTESELEILGTGNDNDLIVPIKPRTVDGNFSALRKRVGLDNIILHDMRTYYASISVALDIPETYIERGGGWKPNSTVLKKHYEMKIQSIEDAYTKKLNDHLSGLFRKKNV